MMSDVYHRHLVSSMFMPLNVIYLEVRDRLRVVSAKLPEGFSRDTDGQEDQAVELYYWDPEE